LPIRIAAELFESWQPIRPRHVRVVHVIEPKMYVKTIILLT
jgi:hypothetical protein